MSLTWEVCRRRDESAGMNLEGNDVDAAVARRMTRNYLVIAKGISDPFEVDTFDAISAPGVPLLKHSVYISPDGSKVYPYFAVQDKSCERNEDNPYMFEVAVEFVDETGGDEQDLQPDPEDYLPSIKYTVKSRQRTGWSDLDGKKYQLPTGSKYQQPLIIDYSSLVAEVTQFENAFSIADLKLRHKKVNTAAWNVMGAEQALISDIKYEKVSVPVGIGYLTGYAETYKVTYMIEENDLTMEADSAAVRYVVDRQNEPVYWRQARPRIDSVVYRNQAGADGISKVIMPASTISESLSWVYLKESGYIYHYPGKKDPADASNDFENACPPIDTFKVYDDISFSFLRV